MGNKILAIIPARKGSKGLKEKNTRTLAGKPMTAMSTGGGSTIPVYQTGREAQGATGATGQNSLQRNNTELINPGRQLPQNVSEPFTSFSAQPTSQYGPSRAENSQEAVQEFANAIVEPTARAIAEAMAVERARREAELERAGDDEH